MCSFQYLLYAHGFNDGDQDNISVVSWNQKTNSSLSHSSLSHGVCHLIQFNFPIVTFTSLKNLIGQFASDNIELLQHTEVSISDSTTPC